MTLFDVDPNSVFYTTYAPIAFFILAIVLLTLLLLFFKKHDERFKHLREHTIKNTLYIIVPFLVFLNATDFILPTLAFFKGYLFDSVRYNQFFYSVHNRIFWELNYFKTTSFVLVVLIVAFVGSFLYNLKKFGGSK